MHSHTLHSKESLDFIYKFASRSPIIRAILARGERQYQRCYGIPLDLTQGWWTPPLGPADAFRLEASQIARLGMQPIVSLTDHDDIDAAMSLRAVEPHTQVLTSVEWTVPYDETFFHLGLHNLPAAEARDILQVLAAYTAQPSHPVLAGILNWLSHAPGLLIVFNHPMWDEMGAGDEIHRAAATRFLRAHGRRIHAIELNGLRPWNENRLAIRFAHEHAKPIVAGGDRHAVEPNAVLNFTNARTFEEFGEEVKAGYSDVWIGNAYRHSHAWRIVRNVVETLQPYGNEWIDRAFFRCPDGQVRSFREIWGDGNLPAVIRAFDAALRLGRSTPFRTALENLPARLPQTVDSI